MLGSCLRYLLLVEREVLLAFSLLWLQPFQQENYKQHLTNGKHSCRFMNSHCWQKFRLIFSRRDTWHWSNQFWMLPLLRAQPEMPWEGRLSDTTTYPPSTTNSTPAIPEVWEIRCQKPLSANYWVSLWCLCLICFHVTALILIQASEWIPSTNKINFQSVNTEEQIQLHSLGACRTFLHILSASSNHSVKKRLTE